MEIEAKMPVESHEPVRDRLRALGARFVGKVLETNQLFDTPERSLSSNDRALRVRVARDVATGAQRIVLTFKGPRQAGLLKSRPEAEFEATDPVAAKAFFQAMGFTRVVSFEKRRETWDLQGCHVELDEVPYLGCFVEVEGPSETDVMQVRDLLGLGDRPLESTSYIGLLLKYLKSHGIDNKQVRFVDVPTPKRD